jgi:hypothetical protein
MLRTLTFGKIKFKNSKGLIKGMRELVMRLKIALVALNGYYFLRTGRNSWSGYSATPINDVSNVCGAPPPAPLHALYRVV